LIRHSDFVIRHFGCRSSICSWAAAAFAAKMSPAPTPRPHEKAAMRDLESYITDVPDFPKAGIVFKDITPLLADAAALGESARRLAEPFTDAGVEIVTGIESRGFIFGALVAQILGAGLVPLRKPGKLPRHTLTASYDLEYGTDAIEMHADAIRPGQKVLMVDDLLATGGTMAAACDLVARAGGNVVGVCFVIELCFLEGRRKLAGYDVHALIRVNGK
jgi:adenine phosphoribosyltransferase